MLQTGIKGNSCVLVSEENTAKTIESGTMNVFATPAMIALMEKTSWQSIVPYLEPGQGSVGIRMNVSHDAPTPIGMTVYCESELVEIDGRRLVFTVVARDDKDVIGKGTHERFLVQEESFFEKATAKIAPLDKN